MALNPQLLPNGIPVPFINEVFVLRRGGVNFQVTRTMRRRVFRLRSSGVIYLTNIRMVFVADRRIPQFCGYDMPLLFIHGEQLPNYYFMLRSTITGNVEPVLRQSRRWPENYSQTFNIELVGGGCATFVPLFSMLLMFLRPNNRHYSSRPEPLHERLNPLPASQIPIEDMIRLAYVDRTDPTVVFFEQPNTGSLRRSAYLTAA